MSWAERYPWATECSRHAPEYFAKVDARPREEWGDGPWQDEPDVVRWTTQAGLPGLIWRSAVSGALCGYAGLTLGHPFFGKRWQQLEVPIAVHGGLSFAGTIDTISNWWLGFDCAHAYDLSPALVALMRDLRHPRHWARIAASGNEPPPPLGNLFEGDRYWTVDAVCGEVELLAGQLVAAGNPEVQAVLDGVRADERIDE